jgi:hypothetical protein
MAPKELRTVLSPLLRSHEEPTEENGEGILNHTAIWIWITANSYVRLLDDCAVEDRHEQQFYLDLTDDTDEHDLLSIHASTLEEAIVCLDYLVGLKDTHFEAMGLTYKYARGRQRLCPFGVNILEKILQTSARRITFNKMIFTPDHCRILASSGTKTSIEFYSCEFQDEGVAFVEASAARQDESSGPATLLFMNSLPFNDRNWASFLSQQRLESLDLGNIQFDSEISCRAVATCEVRCLTLIRCTLEDDGAALVESIRQGRGPKELLFPINTPFRSSASLVGFINSLRGNDHLERLHIGDLQETRALAAALRENKGLVHLKVRFYALDEIDRTELLKAISVHPSLLSLNLEILYSDTNVKKRREFTKAFADMLSVNERIEMVSFYNDTFDKDDWDVFVVPRLECNLYRERFLLIQKIEEASTRAAVLARTLATFSSKPHLVWMFLNQNPDIVSSYLDSSHDQPSIPSQKRSRSPSLDRV